MTWKDRRFDISEMVQRTVRDSLEIHREDYPDLFLAGGYLRDRFLQIPPKDVDFFTFRPPIQDSERVPFDADRSGGGDIRIAEVTHGGVCMEMPIQIIHFSRDIQPSDPRSEVEHFLFGMQQIVLDEERGFIDATEAFWRDIENRTMTVCRCANEKDASIGFNKYKSLLTRYPNWTLVVPTRFAGFYSPHVDFDRNVEIGTAGSSIARVTMGD